MAADYLLYPGTSRWDGRWGFGYAVIPPTESILVYTILVIGGTKGSGGYKNDVWRSENDGKTWTCVNLTPPFMGRMDFPALFAGNLVFFAGGLGISGDDIWSSNDRGVSWSRRFNGNVPRYSHTLIVSTNGLVITYLGGTNKNDVWSLNVIPCGGMSITGIANNI